MSDPIPASLDHYLAMWNEPDLDALGRHLERSCTADVVFADPNALTRGHEALIAMAVEVKRAIPGAIYRRASGIDEQHGRHRYLWEIEHQGVVVVQGMDVATVDDRGLIERIDGFFTPAPPPLEPR
ncbi:MAG: nuclear transport factor 2 family protein [Acidimicrobiia bacterium]|nr:nuclear transport factor 2 family protein [Acidimicrobiia bacterium]